jgi:hypothetical protein
MKNSTLFKKWLLLIAFGVFGFSYSSAAIKADTTVLLSETFATTFGSFTAQSLLGDQVWTPTPAYSCAKMTGFTTVNNANEDWLISPSIDLTGASSIYLDFLHAHRYGKDTINTLQLMVTDTYTTGTVDPGDWTPVLFKLSTQANFNFVNSGYLLLDTYKGKKNVHFAFRYRSNTTASATWEIKNVVLKAIVKVPDVVVMSETFDKVTTNTLKTPGSTDAGLLQTSMDALTVLPGWTGSKVYPAGGALKLGASAVAGILTTPSLDLSAQSGTFNLTFKSMTWSGDTTHLRIYVDNVLAKEITGLNADTFYVFKTYGPYEFTGGTATSKIKFTTSGSVAKNSRFYLDSIVVSQSASTTPKVSLSEVVFKAEAGKTVVKKIGIKGTYLTGDLTITLTNKKGVAFSPISTTIAKANALAGDSIAVTYSPLVAGLDTAILVVSGGGLPSNVQVSVPGGAYKPVVANLAALRAAYVANPDPSVVYTVTGPIVASYINTTITTSASRSVYFQDATGGVLSYESKAAVANIITPDYTVGSAVTGFTGSLTEYGKLLEFVPTVAPAATSTGNALIPVELTIAQAKSLKENYESMLVCVKGLSKCLSNTATVWAVAKANYNFGIGSDSIVLRTNYTLMDYMDGATAISADPTNYAGLLIEYNGAVQIVPRSKTDLGYTGPTSNLSQINAAVTVYGSNGTLNVKTSQGQKMEVYNLMGQRILRTTTSEGVNTFVLGKNQLYLVKVNNTVTKILL